MLQTKGYTRQAEENVVAPTPPMGEIVKRPMTCGRS